MYEAWWFHAWDKPDGTNIQIWQVEALYKTACLEHMAVSGPHHRKSRIVVKRARASRPQAGNRGSRPWSLRTVTIRRVACLHSHSSDRCTVSARDRITRVSESTPTVQRVLYPLRYLRTTRGPSPPPSWIEGWASVSLIPHAHWFFAKSRDY